MDVPGAWPSVRVTRLPAFSGVADPGAPAARRDLARNAVPRVPGTSRPRGG